MLYQESLSCCLQPPACTQPLGLQANRTGQGIPRAVPAARTLHARPSQPRQSDSSPIAATLSFSCDSQALFEWFWVRLQGPTNACIHTMMVWFITLSFGQACLTWRYTDLGLSNGTEKERNICPSKLAPGNTFHAALQRAWQILKTQTVKQNKWKDLLLYGKTQGLGC